MPKIDNAGRATDELARTDANPKGVVRPATDIPIPNRGPAKIDTKHDHNAKRDDREDQGAEQVGETEQFGPESLGRLAYCTYARERDWWTFDGLAMPAWADADEGVRRAWGAAAVAVRSAVAAGKVPDVEDAPPDVDAGQKSDVGVDDPNDPNADPSDDDPYPESGTVGEVLAWVERGAGRKRGVPERTTDALAYEQTRKGGPRAGVLNGLGY